MGDFSESPKWKLVNDFTIHEDQNLSSGRPFMRTRVPKTLDVNVTSFEIVQAITWPSNFGEQRPYAYDVQRHIKVSGDFRDNIVVFNMTDGEIATFKSITDAVIRPLPAGQVGGKNKATVFDGIGYSGMSSRDVPDSGLVDGEPGTLAYLSEFDEPNGHKTPASLGATLFLDEDKFSRLLVDASTSNRPLKYVRLRILAELFESEISASLSEPWMSCNYGLLMKGAAAATTNARIEWIGWSTGAIRLGGDPVDKHCDNDFIERPKVVNYGSSTEPTMDHTRGILNYQRYILVALLILIIVTVLTA